MKGASRIVAVVGLAAAIFPGPAAAETPTVSRDELLDRRRVLRQEIAFEKARLALAKGKSFYLVLDAPARMLTLEISGVPVRNCPIERFEMDRRMAERRKSPSLVDSLAMPFFLRSRSGTIPEIPPPVDADTTLTKQAEKARKKARFSDADLSLHYDRDLIVHITTRPDSTGETSSFQTRFQNRWRLLRLMIRSWLHGGPFRKQSEIFLQIGRTDARAIYWALPDSSGLVMKP